MRKYGENRVFVAMSGGVDSSVAALLLKRQGYEIVGVFMSCWTKSSARINADYGADSRGSLPGCEQERDAEDARRVAEKIGVPFYVWDFEKEYKKRVVEYMVRGYREGITPNPDVMCNKEIKFGLFLEKALAMGADYIATGHYARLREIKNPALGEAFDWSRDEPINPRLVPIIRIVEKKRLSKGILRRRGSEGDQTPETRVPTSVSDHPGPTVYSLYQAKDADKDQSYFLWTLTQKQLKHCLFPVGDYLKPEVRGIAKKAGLPTAEKKDSQGICFLGKVTLADFLKEYIPEKRGDVLTTSGDKVGEHSGVHFYTIGQRHLGIRYQASGVKREGDTKPVYVVEKGVRTNTLIVAERDEPALYRKEVELTGLNFISQTANYKLPTTVFARIRYRQPLQEAKLVISKSKLANGKNNRSSITNYKLLFTAPVKFVAPGQSAVFYIERQATRDKRRGEFRMLGGGIIK